MTVSEGENAGLPMPNGWGILPRGFLVGVVHGEVTVVERFDAFIQEGHRSGRGRQLYLGHLLVLGISRAEHPRGVRNAISCSVASIGPTHAAFQRVTAHEAHPLGSNGLGLCGECSRTLVNSDIGVVWKQKALLERVDIGRTRENVNASYAPINPRQSAREIVWHHDVIVVAAVHDPSSAELAKVADAANALGLELGSGQGGEEQRGKNGDDGDYDQQFDECKAS